jgi:hypothetical protein
VARDIGDKTGVPDTWVTLPASAGEVSMPWKECSVMDEDSPDRPGKTDQTTIKEDLYELKHSAAQRCNRFT